MHRLYISILSALIALTAGAEGLKFGDDGRFKIVQITDTHYRSAQPGNSRPAIDCIDAVLTQEQPDLVIFTGDMVYGDGAERALIAQVGAVKAHGVPYAFVFGNHDEQFDLTLDEMYSVLQSSDACVAPPLAAPGQYDYAVEIASSTSDAPAYVLYCLDTHSSTTLNGKKVYDWLHPVQIDWYQSMSDGYARPDGERVPALMFIHIPLPEMREGADAVKVHGKKGEKVCCSGMNSGMFLALKDKGDVRGVFFGHDHKNDFTIDYDGVLLGYGRFSGGNTVYGDYKNNGARVIVLDEARPDVIETWIRLRDGRMKDHRTFTRSE